MNDLGEICTCPDFGECECPERVESPLCPGVLTRAEFIPQTNQHEEDKCVLKYFANYTCIAVPPVYEIVCEDAPDSWTVFYTFPITGTAQTCSGSANYATCNGIFDLFGNNDDLTEAGKIVKDFTQRWCPKTCGTCDLILEDLASFHPDHVYSYRSHGGLLKPLPGCGPVGTSQKIHYHDELAMQIHDITCRSKLRNRGDYREPQQPMLLGQCGF
eukprot:UN26571